MKNQLVNLCGMYLIIISLLSCTNKDIEKVKKAPMQYGFTGSTNEEFVQVVAGIKDEVTCKSFYPDGYGKNVKCIQVDINNRRAPDSLTMIQFYLNNETGLVTQGKFETNGKTKNQ